MASHLINPHSYAPDHFDDDTRAKLRATIEWFEQRGKERLLHDYHAKSPVSDFLEFAAETKLFATFLTPARDAAGEEGKRWDMSRIVALTEILGFYGFNYMLPFQVSLLGLGAVYQSDNAQARTRAAAAMEAGGVAAFGVSEKAHGADLYSTDMVLTPDGNGGFTATGEKYYIGNGDRATTVAVFGRINEGDENEFVFFHADSRHPAYKPVRNVTPTQTSVSHFRLDGYPVREEDILHRGDDAFSAILNSVNIGKFNLCFSGIGTATHAFYEAISHADQRVLYGKKVTEMSHIRQMLVDSYVRLAGMRMYCDRALDYLRSAGPEDRRYLLFNPVTKMKVATEAESVVHMLGEVVAAKAFEADAFLTAARQDAVGLARLEGTSAINLMLIAKFMPAYLYLPDELPEIPSRRDAADDEFLMRQGPARGLGQVRFQDWRAPYAEHAHLANVAIFLEQAESFAELLTRAAPGEDQLDDFDLLLAFGELFTLVVYGQLILEQARLIEADDGLVDGMFELIIRDFSQCAAGLLGKPGATDAQCDWAMGVIRVPNFDKARFDRIWKDVESMSGAYAMNPGPGVTDRHAAMVRSVAS